VPADTDAAEGFADDLRYLSFTDVLGRYEQVHAEYGLDNPDLTLVLTLKQKLEKKKDEEPEKKDGEGETPEKKDEETKDEFKLVKRVVEIGNKIERAESIDDETGEVKKENYYAVHVGGDFDDPEVEKRANYVFLVDAITLRALFKDLDDLKQPEAEKQPEEDKPGDEEKKEEPAEEKPAEDAAKPEDKPETDQPKDAAPKTDEPKTDEPKSDDTAKPTDDKPADDAPPK
jgi:hypothetical protein